MSKVTRKEIVEPTLLPQAEPGVLDTDNKKLLHFFSSTIQKSIKLKFGYENKAGWSKVSEEKIHAPTHNNQPDYSLMEILISAIQKLVIRDVVDYADRKIAATKTVISK